MAHPYRGFVLPLILIAIALLFAGGGAYFYTIQKDASKNAPIATTTPPADAPINETNGYTAKIDSSEHLIFISPTKTEFVVPDEIAMTIDSGFISQMQSQTRYTVVTSNWMPINPISKNSLLLTTRDTGVGAEDPLNYLDTLYSYDLSTHALTQLAIYQDTTNPYRELIILGTQGSKVIFWSHTVGSGGPCGNPWSEADRLKYYDLSNPAAGFQTYQVSAAKVAEEDAKMAACLKDLGI